MPRLLGASAGNAVDQLPPLFCWRYENLRAIGCVNYVPARTRGGIEDLNDDDVLVLSAFVGNVSCEPFVVNVR